MLKIAKRRANILKYPKIFVYIYTYTYVCVCVCERKYLRVYVALSEAA